MTAPIGGNTPGISGPVSPFPSAPIYGPGTEAAPTLPQSLDGYDPTRPQDDFYAYAQLETNVPPKPQQGSSWLDQVREVAGQVGQVARSITGPLNAPPTNAGAPSASLAPAQPATGSLADLVARAQAAAAQQAPAQPDLTADAVSHIDIPSKEQVSDQDFVTGLYRQILGREPEPEGLAAHLNGLAHGTSRETLVNAFLTCPEFKEIQARKVEGGGGETKTGPQPNDPSTWTDDNCPYGITLAGFSPQNHTDLTVEDLGTPGKAEKYAVYNYFLENKTQPTKDWAPAAAAALNARYHTDVYHAIDGETLGYGNEYVHSAPNGYGIPPGTYNPNATGELFWGCTD